MSLIIWEIVIIFLLTLINGLLVCAEIAVVSVRKTRIAQLAKKGNSRAKIIQQFHQFPDRLFATIQIGVSVITVAASALAGSNLAEPFARVLQHARNSFIVEHSFAVALIIVVIVVSFIMLIIGELVPKSLGLRFAEKFSLTAAYPLLWLSKINRWLVKLLNFFSNLLLRPFGRFQNPSDSRLSEEEIRSLISEGRRAGTIDPGEHNIIENVFEFADLTVGRIMVPRTQVVAFDVEDDSMSIAKKAIESGYSRLPIYQDTLNNIVGILYTKKLLKKLGEDVSTINLRDFLNLPYFVPNTMKITEVLQRLQRKKMHMALVTDEHGEIEGLVTLEDILEEIVGEIADETDETAAGIVRHPDGSVLASAELSVVDFNRQLNTQLPEDADFTTVSGFLLDKLGRFPQEGDVIVHEDLEFLVKEKTPRTVKTVIVKRKTPT